MEPLYKVFKIKFNPHLKKNKIYNIFTESVVSLTYGPLKLYINFNDGFYDDVSIYDKFMGYISTIKRISVIISDNSGNIIEERDYIGEFESCMHTQFSYEPHLKFLAVFVPIKMKINKNE